MASHCILNDIPISPRGIQLIWLLPATLTSTFAPCSVYSSHAAFFLGEGNGHPLQCSCLETPVDGEAWWAAVHGVTQSRTRLERLSMHACIGEGNGSPLQCSCLENPRDGGAWWAAVYGIAQSRTRLKRLSSSSNHLSALRHSFPSQALCP